MASSDHYSYLSICIVNWNTRDYLRDCLASLVANPPTLGVEIIVVDNASADRSAEMVAAEFPQVKLIANVENLGYAEGNNQALTAAQGDVVLLLNPDVVIPAGALSKAIAFLEEHPRCGALGCRLIGSDDATQRSVRGFPEPAAVLWEFLGIARLFPKIRRFGAYRMTCFDYEHSAQVDQPMGTFLMIPRAALTHVGQMDPQFPIFFNEVDWCVRAKQEFGWEIWYTPDAVITHFGGAGTGQAKRAMIEESHRSLLRFYEKHYKKNISPMIYKIIQYAVLLNEWRLLRKSGTR